MPLDRQGTQTLSAVAAVSAQTCLAERVDELADALHLQCLPRQFANLLMINQSPVADHTDCSRAAKPTTSPTMTSAGVRSPSASDAIVPSVPIRSS